MIAFPMSLGDWVTIALTMIFCFIIQMKSISGIGEGDSMTRRVITQVLLLAFFCGLAAVAVVANLPHAPQVLLACVLYSLFFLGSLVIGFALDAPTVEK